MTRPTVLDMDLVVVPREATDEMLEPANFGYSPDKFATLWDAMLSASPYPTAWDDVRKYVEGLETEVERLKDELGDPDGVVAHADSITKLSEARIAELEAALDEKEVASGLTENGNLWRFWSTKASTLAVRNAELEKRMAGAGEVIAFYADERNWVDTPSWDGDPECITEKAIPVDRSQDGTPCDCGDVARAWMDKDNG